MTKCVGRWTFKLLHKAREEDKNDHLKGEERSI